MKNNRSNLLPNWYIRRLFNKPITPRKLLREFSSQHPMTNLGHAKIFSIWSEFAQIFAWNFVQFQPVDTMAICQIYKKNIMESTQHMIRNGASDFWLKNSWYPDQVQFISLQLVFVIRTMYRLIFRYLNVTPK